jgi:hypothetical protein
MDEIQRQTNLSIIGFWRTEWDEGGTQKKIEISIRREGDFKLIFREFSDEELIDEVIYSPLTVWLRTWLLLTGSGRLFYVVLADNKRMIFGEANTNVVGDIKWQREFERIYF